MVSLGSFGPRGTPSQQVSFRKTEALMEMNILDIRLFWDCTKPGGRNLTHFIHFILHYYNENKGAAMLFLCSSVLTKTNNSYLFVISQINICTKHLKAQTRAANKVWAREALYELKLLLWLLLEPGGASALSWAQSPLLPPCRSDLTWEALQKPGEELTRLLMTLYEAQILCHTALGAAVTITTQHGITAELTQQE